MAATVAQAWGQAGSPALKIDSGDTAWVLISAALVLLMTAPGLALFYGGMVRRKNVLGDLDAELHPGRPDHRPMGPVRLQSGLFARPSWFDRRAFVDRFEFRGSGAQSRLCGDHSAHRLHALPVHVCRHHSRAYYRRDRGADQLSGLPAVQSVVGDASFTIRWRIGCGARADGCISLARWILPAARWCTSPRACRRWRRRCWWAAELAIRTSRCHRTT